MTVLHPEPGNRNWTGGLGALLALLLSGGAEANGLSLEEGARTDWGGAYVGAQVSYATSDATSDGTDERFDGSGAGFGLHAGYRFDFGSWVAGGELDYNRTSLDYDDVPSDIGIDSLAYVKLTGGADFGPLLAYGTVGRVFADLSSEGFGDVDGQGWFAGVGGHYRISDRFSIGAEYKHGWLRDFDASSPIPFDVEIDTDMLDIRAAYRF